MLLRHARVPARRCSPVTRERLAQVVSKSLGLPESFPVAKTVFTNDDTKKARMKELQDYLHVVASLCESSPPRVFAEFLGIDPEQVRAEPRGDPCSAGRSPLRVVTAVPPV